MKLKAIASGTDKTWLVIFETGDELMAGLLRFAKDNKLSGSHFTAIGALQSAQRDTLTGSSVSTFRPKTMSR